jgi:hypothetical protein
VKHDKETSIQESLKGCEDFANVTPQLEFIAHNWGLSSASHPSVIQRLLDKALNMPGGIPIFVSAMVSMMLSLHT